MKRVIFSLLCGLGIFVGYFVFLGLIHHIFDLKFATLQTLLEPVNFPYNVYKMIFGSYRGDPRVVKALTIIADVLILATLFYAVFTQAARLKASCENQAIGNPPEPPHFQ